MREVAIATPILQLMKEILDFFDLTTRSAKSQRQPDSRSNFKVKCLNLHARRIGRRSFPDGMNRLSKAGRLHARLSSLAYLRFLDDFRVMTYSNVWINTSVAGRTEGKLYVVQTIAKVIERCILMATDSGDLVLDPTCGSGTTATVAEQWGRRWITIDTSRVALARIMGARYPFYLLADSRDGQTEEAEVTRTAPSEQPVRGNIRHGFVYERVPHITLKSIANNAEIDVIWDKWQEKLSVISDQ